MQESSQALHRTLEDSGQNSCEEERRAEGPDHPSEQERGDQHQQAERDAGRARLATRRQAIAAGFAILPWKKRLALGHQPGCIHVVQMRTGRSRG